MRAAAPPANSVDSFQGRFLPATVAEKNPPASGTNGYSALYLLPRQEPEAAASPSGLPCVSAAQASVQAPPSSAGPGQGLRRRSKAPPPAGHGAQQQEPESSLHRGCWRCCTKYRHRRTGWQYGCFLPRCPWRQKQGRGLEVGLRTAAPFKAHAWVAQQGGNLGGGLCQIKHKYRGRAAGQQTRKFALPHLSKANNQTVNARKRNKYGVELCGGLCAHV